MKTEYKKNVNGVYLVLEEEKEYKEDYQIQMIAANEITGILPLKAQGMNRRSRYYYTISGKVSMKAMYEKSKIGKQDLTLFLNQLLQTTRAIYDHMLNINRIMLEPEYIFYEGGRFYFCYYPLRREELSVQFHRFTEYIVRQVDYEDKEVICMAYELHKKSLEDNYSIEHAIAQISQEQEEEKEESEEKAALVYEPELQMDYAQSKTAGIKKRLSGRSPLSDIFQRRRSKWGVWNNLP